MSGHGNSAGPVIIKRKKVVAGDGHHGGAWKVAYADFVTAMMAFFLLMWLLNATTETQRKGIADYFSPTIPISRVSGGGDGSFGGDSIFSEENLPQNGVGGTNARPIESHQALGETGLMSEGTQNEVTDSEFASKIEEALLGQTGESMVSQEALRHIVTRVTDEGLIIEVFDLESAQLFEKGTDKPQPLLTEIAAIIASASNLVENQIAVEGHLMSAPIIKKENPVWDLSISRADMMRRLLELSGLSSDRFNRVTGHADRKAVVKNRMSVRNNRLEIILLRDM